MVHRIVFVHWKQEEADHRVEELHRLGYRVDRFPGAAGSDPKSLRENPPDLFLIDLGRLPAQGRELAGWFRRQRATRSVPLVFVGGLPGKVSRVRELFPDAVFCEWEAVSAALEEALKRPPEDPKVPGTFEVYRGVPLSKKLGIKSGTPVVLLGAPAGFEKSLVPLPKGVTVRRSARGGAHRVLLFVRSVAGLEKRFEGATAILSDGGALWICWPKKASGVHSDLTQGVVRSYGLHREFVDFKICAIDETWSGLCFVPRRRYPASEG